jgi:simple sugar transport system ATP-binding protein
MGQNGAGKSTLIKVLTGVESIDSGDIILAGKPIRPHSVFEVQELGISTVYQEVNLCPNLSVAENIFIGRFPFRFGRIDWKTMQSKARTGLAALNIDIDVSLPLSSYPVAIQQMVAIARALSTEAQVLILDEPTSSLDEDEVARLFDVLRRLKAKGIAILFVTHFLDQTYAISDRITVLRNGEFEGEYLAKDLSRMQLINKMVGREVDESSFARQAGDHADKARAGEPFLAANHLGRAGMLRPIDLSVYSGQVLGLGGLLGSGRTETAHLRQHKDQRYSGEAELPAQGSALGARFLPGRQEDRGHHCRVEHS